ncbi:hypothetical protein [Altibacter sp. HG106]|uniref:hypothetical protein n=1 Tax=Altibacter sp. HG106 TaxID=3023937 RepID=UPI002350B875|nr:hypothetical protein [Altibacter sp. HG106]MDC7993821.1 hypothetical protein [Altibacter sp. HG106]
MKTTILVISLVLSNLLWAQSPYQKGMTKAFELWGQNKTTQAAQLFERISTVETDNWLPPFYAAQVLIIDAFSAEDKAVMAELLKQAEGFLQTAQSLSPNNPEIMVAQSQLLTAWIVYDSDQYGMKNSMKVTEIYKKAMALAPENPRVVLGNAEWNIGSAKFFKKDVTPYCSEVQRAIDLFATFKPEGEFYPSGGKERALEVLKVNCEK